MVNGTNGKGGLRQKYQLAIEDWQKYELKHRYTAPSVDFAAGTTEGTALEATKNMEYVIVPIVRSKNTSKLEETTLFVTYPDEDAPHATNLVWEVDDAEKRIRVDVSGRWQAGAVVTMTLSDTSTITEKKPTGTTIGHTATIKFVTAANSFSFPDMQFDESADFGQWTLCSAANWAKALAKAQNANTYYQVETNATDGTVTTNEYQYGAAGREQGGLDPRPMQSFVLKVTGGAVWSSATVAFAADVIDSDEFRAWCEANNIVTILEECSDPSTGASLFSYAIAANGRSGAAFVSRNGLDESTSEKPAASNVFEVALYRPDGTLGAVLAPQRKDGKYDKAENLVRLTELLDTADDLTEPWNDDPESVVLKSNYGETIVTGSGLYTLNVSDKKDVFELCGVPAGEFVTIAAVSEPTSLNGEKPQVSVWSRSQGGGIRTIEPIGTAPDGRSVWMFGADEAANIYADVTAWTKDNVATEILGTTKFTYPLTVTKAPDVPGEIAFVNNANEVYDVDSEITIELKVKRTGYTGDAEATVEIVSNELPAASFSWPCGSNNETNLFWREGEYGEKTIPITVRNVLWEESVSNLVFEIKGTTGAALDEKRKFCTMGIQQEDDINALTGRIRISSPEFESGQAIWVKSGASVDVTVTRERVRNPLNDKDEARGEAFATVAATGGAELDSAKLEWRKGERVGDRKFTVTMPSVGKAGEQKVVVTVVGTDGLGQVISDMTTGRVKFMVVPANSPEFMDEDKEIEVEAYQYVSFEKRARLKSGYASGDTMEIAGFELVSGKLPDGLSATADAEGLLISGTPAGTNSAVVVYQLKFLRKADGYMLKTMPVVIKITGKALGGTDGAGGSDNAILPAFAERRVWQHLPMTNDEGRLAGLLNLSASKRGSISARYTTFDKTFVFTKPSLDDVSLDAGSGGYLATAAMKGADDSSLDVTFTTDGRVFATFSPYEGPTAGFASEKGSVPWTQVDGGAGAWKGRYAVAIPLGNAPVVHDAHGTGALALNISSAMMARSGRVTFNGLLPNGKPMNGTTSFVPAAPDASSVRLPIVWSSANDAFSAMLVLSQKNGGGIEVSADPAVEPYWSGADGAGIYAEGGSFVAADWASAWANPAGALLFKYDGNAGGATVELDGASLKVKDKGSPQHDGFALESIALNRATGMVSGTVKVQAEGQVLTASFKGAALSKGSLVKGSAWYSAERDGETVRIAVPVEVTPAGQQ